MKKQPKKPAAKIQKRLEYLRKELRAERISYGELSELQALSKHIEPGDTELLEAAGVKEFPTEEEKLTEKIEAAIIRQQVSHRGGGVEISLDSFGFEGERMSAYQNYLGGGMLGAIQTNDTIRRQSLQAKTKKDADRLDKIALALAKYFHGLTNHEGDEWESATFEQNQKRPRSAY